MSRTYFSWNNKITQQVQKLVDDKRLKGMEIHYAAKVLEYVLYRRQHNSKASLNYIKEQFLPHCWPKIDKVVSILLSTADLKGELNDLDITLDAPVDAPVRPPQKKKEEKKKDKRIKNKDIQQGFYFDAAEALRQAEISKQLATEIFSSDDMSKLEDEEKERIFDRLLESV